MVYGRRFTLQTDHKPLLKVFGSKKGIPVYTANRLQRWALTLLLYNFEIQFVPTASFGHADLLSRLMDSHKKSDEEYVIAAIQMETDVKTIFEGSISNLPVTSDMISKQSAEDPTLQEVFNYIQNGWPESAKTIADPTVRQFFSRRDSLQVFQDCIMFGDRVVVPALYRKRILRQLHRGHPGMERMKSIARSFVYWPNIDDDVEDFVRRCSSCAQAVRDPRKTTLESWPLPSKPMERIHIDYAGPIDGFYYLVIVDAYSKWPEVFRTRSTTTTATLDFLQETFARYGYPHTLVSDNGSQFISAQFQQFCKEHGIQHLTTAPYHPQSNGQAERFVDSLKRGLKKLANGESMATTQHLQTFLSVYRSTPARSAPDGKTPAHLFLGRQISTQLDLLKPTLPSPTRINDAQNAQFNKHHGAVQRKFVAGNPVLAKVHQGNSAKWIPGRIIEPKGNVMYTVLLDNGRLIRSHTNQLKAWFIETAAPVPTPNLPLSVLLDDFVVPVSEADQTDSLRNEDDLDCSEYGSPLQSPEVPPPRTRPTRNRCPPKRLSSYDLS